MITIAGEVEMETTINFPNTRNDLNKIVEFMAFTKNRDANIFRSSYFHRLRDMETVSFLNSHNTTIHQPLWVKFCPQFDAERKLKFDKN